MGDLELWLVEIIIIYRKSGKLNLRIIATEINLLVLICVAFQVHWNFSEFACAIGKRDWVLG
jgi:hypothetical protein